MSFDRIDFSTDSFPSEDRDAFLRDYYARIAMRFELAPIDGAPIAVRARSMLLPGVALTGGAVSALGAVRTRSMRSDGQSDILFTIPRDGLFVQDALRGDVAVAPGEALVSALDRPIKVIGPSQTNRMLSFQISRQALAPLVPDIDDRLTGRLALGSPGLGLLHGYALSLLGLEAMRPDVGRAAARHLVELVALAIGATGEGRERASTGGLRAARLAAAKKAILRGLGSPGLSAVSVAAQLGISPRYLHMLFEGEGYSFSEFLTEQRLVRALELLADSRRRIVDVAYEVGFGDVGTFNRAFRRRFGQSPTGMRRGWAERVEATASSDGPTRL